MDKVEEYVKEYMQKYMDPSHDWLHVDRVRNMALKIASNLPYGITVDKSLIEICALLHDVGDKKFLKAGESTEMVLENACKKVKIEKSFADIIWIIKRISYSNEISGITASTSDPLYYELVCVQDADRLDAIGSIGIARCFSYNAARNLPMYNSKDLRIQDYSKSSSSNARNHFYEKLLFVKDRIKTDYALVEAERRHKFIKIFISQFDDECGLNHNQ